MDKKKFKIGYDFDGVVTEGIVPDKEGVIITGNTKDKEIELRKKLEKMGVKNLPIIFFPDKSILDKYTEDGDMRDIMIGKWKAKVIDELGITKFYEDSEKIIEIIKSVNPKIDIVHIHNASKKTVLWICNDVIAIDIPLRIQQEGHTVLIAQKQENNVLEGTLKRVPFGERGKYIKQADLIVYEDTHFGDEPKLLRDKGFSVIGGSNLIDKMEFDREFGAKLAKAAGLKVPFSQDIHSFNEARALIKNNPKRWVLKQQGALDSIKGLNYVAKFDDSKDLVDHLDWLEGVWVKGLPVNFVLQEFIKGHEFAVGAYWNGNEFMRDKDGDEICEENWEHKALMPGDMGESTGEMFTVAHYRKAKDSRLFMETLDKCRDLLKKVNYRGDADVNCKITEDGAYFLEFTNRFGNPISSGQVAIHKTSWYEFLKACADGRQIQFEYDPRFVIVAWLYTKPFPSSLKTRFAKLIEDKYRSNPPKNAQEMKELLETRLNSSKDVNVYFREPLTKDELNNLHFESVYFDKGKLKVANEDGFVLTVTGQGDSVSQAADELQCLLKKLFVPKGFYRNDFGAHYFESCEDLQKWGYLGMEKEGEMGYNKDMTKDEFYKNIEQSVGAKTLKEIHEQMESKYNAQIEEEKKLMKAKLDQQVGEVQEKLSANYFVQAEQAKQKANEEVGKFKKILKKVVLEN